MRRRTVLRCLAAAATGHSLPAGAQSKPGVPTIGFLLAASAPTYTWALAGFIDGMRALGYEEGRNVTFVYHFANGDLARLADLAAQLVATKPAVIVSSPLVANLAAQRATNTIPIVMANGADPVGFGLVASLSRPGGNITGLSNFAELMTAKHMDIARELIPGLSRLAVLINFADPLHVPQLAEARRAATEAKLVLVTLEVRKPEDLPGAFARLADAGALLVLPDFLVFQQRKVIAELAAKHRIPAIYGFSEHALDGGLLSYGPNVAANFRRAASFVDRILKGARPADLPIEQPRTIELLINLRAAQAIGLTVPASVLARADALIE